MNRVCRMVLATCLGSFVLVIFYFQSMLHPGKAVASAGRGGHRLSSLGGVGGTGGLTVIWLARGAAGTGEAGGAHALDMNRGLENTGACRVWGPRALWDTRC
ncbi:hypothetical protein NDU88_004035 [Pleurodeles waltl]|uniref:Uncharacterized protein n=1 Tax=Pleurodeles waltl TaxID=8319 RepID=A0AAV7SHM1_PLEWA|nr:hypothetical protein NDU88_004035 [Pleurodeles waltl]